MKRALVLGPGQDGSYLCEILLERDHETHVMHRRSSVDNLRRIRHLLPRVAVHRGDVTESASLRRVLQATRPDWIFCTADQDDVSWSREIPEYSLDVTAGGPLRLLEAAADLTPQARVFLPISATVFGDNPPPQNEQTPLKPQSPFAVAKAAALHLVRYYREVRGLWVATSISFNHDSPERSEDYVLHKICKAAVRIARGDQLALTLGSLEQQIDIGYARDYMEAAVRMLEADAPDDYVIGTGVAWPIRAMVAAAFEAAGVEREIEQVVRVDKNFRRPGPQPCHVADPRKAERQLGWKAKTGIAELIGMLVRHEQENHK